MFCVRLPPGTSGYRSNVQPYKTADNIHTQTPFRLFLNHIIIGVLVVLVRLRHSCVGFVFQRLSVAENTEDV